MKAEIGDIDAGRDYIEPHRSLGFIVNVLGSHRKVLNDYICSGFKITVL